jgi:Holliday junction resolvase
MATTVEKPKRRSPKRQAEGVLKKAVCDYLRLRGFMAFYIHQSMYSYNGISDVIAIKNGISFYIETKMPGKKQTDDQIQFQEDVEAKGAEYALIHSLEEIVEWVQKH